MTSRVNAAAIAAVIVCSLQAVPALADDPFIGRWSLDPAGCTGFGTSTANAPMFVTDQTVKWFMSSCTIKKSYRIGDTLALQASCWSDGKTSIMPIGLTLHGKDKVAVTWDKTQAGEMRRCK